MLSARFRAACVLALLSATASARGSGTEVVVDLQSNAIPDLLTSLFAISLTDGVSTGSFRIESGSENSSDTRLSTLHVPYRHEFDVGSSLGTLELSAIAGALWADDEVQFDLDRGRAEISEDWLSIGGQVGAAWKFPLAPCWTLSPGVGLGLLYTQNDARYNAVAAEVFQPALDGRLVNFEAWATVASLSLTLEKERVHGELDWGLVARGTAARTDVFSGTSDFQEGADEGQVLVARAELGGPTGWNFSADSVDWDAFAGWVALYDVDRDVLGFDSFAQLGGGLTLRPIDALPRVQFGGAWIVGEDITGWSLGLSLDL